MHEQEYMDVGQNFHCVGQWFPTFFDAFLPLLILELFIPPLLHNFFSFLPYYTSLQEYLIYQYIVSLLTFTCHGVAYCSGSWTRGLVLTAIGTMDFIEDNNLINKSGTKLFVK